MASSLLSSLDMSLDDLIASKKKKSPQNPDARPDKIERRGGRQGSIGPIRKGRRDRVRRTNQPYARHNVGEDTTMDVDDDQDDAVNKVTTRRATIVNKKRAIVVKRPVPRENKKGSILSRLGGPETSNTGTKIFVKNLKFDILEDDVRELFNTVGQVTKAEIVYDRSGRSKGVARVWFGRRSDAEKAIKQYDGRTLDGQPMQIALDNDTNVREGLFGTALNKTVDRDVHFKVNIGGKRGGRGGGRGGGRSAGRSGRVQHGQSSKSMQDLDNEMDTYMKE
ncbi:unnamed protein product [Albugo candida]|uniref:RRM domain-containing protein n=1 Tax=Albugo candida TaxID=65357 RepID=A0A024GSE9_9STRA|nr:unnamed protein product [Albugo candida]|eukprot:CCI49719.1 unnamed protein product [Albugo candida]